MGLKSYKGHEANRAYENSFFRIFQNTLKNLFEQKNLDGVLIGHPKTIGDDSLWPDCILITPNRVVIIDFKNYSDIELRLPEPYAFENAPWATNIGRNIKGGSDNNANPFVQLKKQRAKLESLVGDRINEDVGGVACLVVFQGDIIIKGEIPKKYGGWFDIADEFSFGNAIYDMVDVRSKEKNDPEAFRQRYFKSSIYEENIPTIDLDAYITVEEANQKVEAARHEKNLALQAFEEQKRENRRLREQGESVEEGIKLVQEKEAILKAREADLKSAIADFDEKRNAYNIAKATLEKEIEITKQEVEKTKQAELHKRTEHEKTLQAEAKARAEDAKYKQTTMIERRKKISVILRTIFTAIFLIALGVFITSQIIKANSEKQAEKDQAEKALIEDKKSGKTCIGLDELKDYVGIQNVCVEYIVGHIGESKDAIYLNHTKNPDFVTIIWKNSNIITSTEAKSQYLNKRIRVRGVIKWYESEKYKYHEITVKDLSQITML